MELHINDKIYQVDAQPDDSLLSVKVGAIVRIKKF